MSTASSWTACLQFAPVGGDHVGRGGQAGGAAKLRHDLAAGEALLGAARIFGVGQHMLLAAAESHGFLEGPGAVGIERDARSGNRSASAVTVSISCAPGKTPPLSLKS